jgi:hypothetical protein
MIITCDSKAKMGYIRLMPFVNSSDLHNSYEKRLVDNDLSKYLDIKFIKIPVSNNFKCEDKLNMMKISEKTYKEVLICGIEFSEEYQNDLDVNGYMKGIELDDGQ